MKPYLAILSVLFLTSCLLEKTPDSCVHTKHHILVIGGCNSSGECGALLEDGSSVMNAEQPVMGARPRGSYCRILPQ